MFLHFRSEVEDALSAALSSLDLPADDLGIEEPPEDVDAVLASSAPFRLASVAGRAPADIAADVADAIDPSGYDYIDAATTQGPYVNFTPTDAYYADTLTGAQAEDWGRLDDRGESVVVEHTSANPTGPVHVGRARNPIIGDAVARVMDWAGYDVDKHYYVNDAGRQMAVFTWAYETFDEDDLDEPPARDRIEYDLVRYYRKGNAYLEEADPEDVDAAEDEIQQILLGLEEGAWQLDLAEFGYEKKLVFLRSDGTSLYTTRDLAHHEWKFETYDRAITVLGEDHKLQAGQLQAALDLLGHDTGQLTDLIYSYVNLPEGKMSTRRGTGVQLDDLLDESIDRARDAVESRLDTRIRGDDLTEDDVERIARQVGIGAVRYDIVSKQPTKAITFEWDDALDFEGQSAPYIQYAHARTCGILDGNDVPDDPDFDALDAPEEARLLREIARFPGVIHTAAEDLEPHAVATFSRDFVDAFNAFYRECPVLADDVDPAVRDARLGLVAAARATLANSLGVLGIEAPESM